MYTREDECLCCGATYIATSPTQKYCCKECQKLTKDNNIEKWSQRVRTETEARFAPVNEFVKRHYEETGEFLTYGKAVVLMERKEK